MNSDDISTITDNEDDSNSNDNLPNFSEIVHDEIVYENNDLLENELPSFNNNFIEPNFSYFDNFMNSNTIIPLNNLSNINNNYLFNLNSNYLNLTPNTLNDSNYTTSLNNNLLINNSSNLMNISDNLTNDNLFSNSTYNILNNSDSTTNLNNNLESVTEQSSDDINTDYNNNDYETLLSNGSINSMNVHDGVNNSNDQYTLLHDNEDVNNPFFKCNIEDFGYETDDEDNEDIRIILSWYYEFNYDYYNINDISICISKGEYFRSVLNKFKVKKSNLVNKIIKLDNEVLKKDDNVFLYLIIFYDNAKVNIDFYGIFNQQICDEKLLDNIKKENIYGKKGIVNNEMYANNLAENDFIILSKKLKII
tara:strand:- start:2393 stop:3484 length:1092 start_codon:yes stop_codon:yes gene_type:complete